MARGDLLYRGIVNKQLNYGQLDDTQKNELASYVKENNLADTLRPPKPVTPVTAPTQVAPIAPEPVAEPVVEPTIERRAGRDFRRPTQRIAQIGERERLIKEGEQKRVKETEIRAKEAIGKLSKTAKSTPKEITQIDELLPGGLETTARILNEVVTFDKKGIKEVLDEPKTMARLAGKTEFTPQEKDILTRYFQTLGGISIEEADDIRDNLNRIENTRELTDEEKAFRILAERKSKAGTAMAVTSGFTRPVTIGGAELLARQLVDEEDKERLIETVKEARAERPLETLGATIAGILTPGGFKTVFTKVARPGGELVKTAVGKKLTGKMGAKAVNAISKTAGEVVEGIIAEVPITIADAISEKDDMKQLVKRFGANALLGAVIDVGVTNTAIGLKQAFKRAKDPVEKETIGKALAKIDEMVKTVDTKEVTEEQANQIFKELGDTVNELKKTDVEIGVDEVTRADDIITPDEIVSGRPKELEPDIITPEEIELGTPKEAIEAPVTEVTEPFKGKIEPDVEVLRAGFNPFEAPPVKKAVEGAPEAFKFSDETAEQLFKEGKGIKEKTIFEKTKDTIGEVATEFRRTFGELPETPEFAEAKRILLQTQKAKALSQDEAIRALDNITLPLKSTTDLDIFTKKLLLDDAMEDIGNDIAPALGLTKEGVQRDLKDIEKFMTPQIKEALETRGKELKRVTDDYIKSMKDVGLDLTDRFKKENYFRHQVLDHYDANTRGTVGVGKSLKTPKERGFAKGRTGKGVNINTNYFEAEYEVMSQMMHDAQVAKRISEIKANYDITDTLKKQAKEQGVKVNELIPEGYREWQPRDGEIFFTANTIPEAQANKLLEGALGELNVSADDIRQVLAVGPKRPSYIIPDEIAKTLDNFFIPKKRTALEKLAKPLLSKWKGWVLTGNPFSVAKYNIRNFTGDIDPVISANPSSLKRVAKSKDEIWKAIKGGEFTPELKEYYNRGGFQATLAAQELGDVKKLEPFKRFKKDKTLIEKLIQPVKGTKDAYVNLTRDITDAREGVLRYATYLDYLDQMQKSGGTPKNFGASKKANVMALKDIRDRAYKLSNDLLGNYDEISEAGKRIRESLIPFYSFMEVNAKRYLNLVNNQVIDPARELKMAKSLTGVAKITPKVASKIVKGVIALNAFTIMVNLWNQGVEKITGEDLSEKLPEDVRNRSHILLGQDKEGRPIYFTRVGALQDFTDWFGLDTAPSDLKDVLNNRMTIKEWATNVAKSPVNKIASGITPAIKTPVELLTRKNFYPDVFNPRTARERDVQLASSLQLADIYRKIAGKPSKPWKDILQKAVVYTNDPNQSAYYEINSAKYRFNEKKKGKREFGFADNPKSNALYNYKIARRYGDKVAEEKYLQLYFDNGGSEKGLATSERSFNPLYGVKKEDTKEFLSTLTTQQRNKFDEAYGYYVSLLQNERNISKASAEHERVKELLKELQNERK